MSAASQYERAVRAATEFEKALGALEQTGLAAVPPRLAELRVKSVELRKRLEAYAGLRSEVRALLKEIFGTEIEGWNVAKIGSRVIDLSDPKQGR